MTIITAYENWTNIVKQADTLDELEQITEAAGNDDSISNEEYTQIYSLALAMAQRWIAQSLQPQHSRTLC